MMKFTRSRTLILCLATLLCGTDAAFAQGNKRYERGLELGLDAYGSDVSPLGGVGGYLGEYVEDFMFAWRASWLSDSTRQGCAFGPAVDYTLSRTTPRRIKPTVGASIEGIFQCGQQPRKSPNTNRDLERAFNGQGMLTAGVQIVIHPRNCHASDCFGKFSNTMVSLKVLAFSGKLYGKDRVSDQTTKGIVLGITFD